MTPIDDLVRAHGHNPAPDISDKELQAMTGLQWGEPEYLTDEQLDAETTDPMERWFWRTFTSWDPAPEDDDREADR